MSAALKNLLGNASFLVTIVKPPSFQFGCRRWRTYAGVRTWPRRITVATSSLLMLRSFQLRLLLGKLQKSVAADRTRQARLRANSCSRQPVAVVSRERFSLLAAKAGRPGCRG